jgi:ribosomal-protein-alanine N-acetyltransferase
MEVIKNHVFTERLNLVPFNENDIILFYDLNTNLFIRKYLWDDEVIEMGTAKEIIEKNKQHFIEDKFGIWKIQLKTSNEVIGYAGLWYFFEDSQPQLIYAILERYTKYGYATEASQAVVDYAFNRLNFEYLIAATDEPHIASQQVAKRLGMSLVDQSTVNGKQTMFYRINR